MNPPAPQIIRCFEGDAANVVVTINPEAGTLLRYEHDANLLLLSEDRSPDRVSLWFKPVPGTHNVNVRVETTLGYRFDRRAVIDCAPAPWLHDCGFPG